jgi:hypothetical protein
LPLGAARGARGEAGLSLFARHPVRPLWRAAASIALLAFFCLPHGHLRGHEEVAAARALATSAPAALAAAPLVRGDEARSEACPVCLSHARVRHALASSAAVPVLALAAETPLAPPPAPQRPEAPTSGHTAPRAPPLV